MSELFELMKSVTDASRAAFNAGHEAGYKKAQRDYIRLKGAVEDYLDGEMQSNVGGLREALAAIERFT